MALVDLTIKGIEEGAIDKVKAWVLQQYEEYLRQTVKKSVLDQVSQATDDFKDANDMLGAEPIE